MNNRHWKVLEFPKILSRLAGYCSFSASRELAQALEPSFDLGEIRDRLSETREARTLSAVRPDVGLGGAHDVRPQVEAAVHGSTLPALELLDVRDTLVAARTMQRSLVRLEQQFPLLAGLAARIQPCPTLIEAVDRSLDERGNVRDDASPALARIRREQHIAHDRLQERLQRIIASPRNAPYLQEMLITQREGRYVIPLKADFKGRIRGVVHDRSSSGATIFIEPLAVIELNNAWIELQLQEEQEVNRILAALSAQVAEDAYEIRHTVEALAELDLAFAKARYADEIDAVEPELLPFRKMKPVSPTAPNYHPGSTVRLIRARHPLLDPRRVVPIDVDLDEETHVVIITGPNTGGKTVTLKTVGLLALMAQAGLHIPAEQGSALSPFAAVYADIGDEQSIEQSLSTFSAHLTNILSFLHQADPHSLVLLDELGAGTDPAEGAALAHALLETYRRQGSTCFVATHYPELKGYAQTMPGVRNASVEFDPQTLSPTYHLTIGLPGRSNAFAIARRLGLDEPVVKEAQALIGTADLRAEDMLADIHSLRVQAARARDEATVARRDSERASRDLQRRLAQIEDERQEVLDRARKEAASELETLRSELRALRRRMQAAGTAREEVSAIEADAQTLEELIRLPEPEPLAPPPVPLPRRAIRAGDRVHVRPLNAEGDVLSLDRKEAEVQIGVARMRLPLAQLELRARAAPPPTPEPEQSSRPSAPSPGMRLDLRGATVEEALAQVERHLDAAALAGLPWVHIIHGKGTGALRLAVHKFLRGHPLVKSYEPGGDKEGGDGVTIAKLTQT